MWFKVRSSPSQESLGEVPKQNKKQVVSLMKENWKYPHQLQSWSWLNFSHAMFQNPSFHHWTFPATNISSFTPLIHPTSMENIFLSLNLSLTSVSLSFPFLFRHCGLQYYHWKGITHNTLYPLSSQFLSSMIMPNSYYHRSPFFAVTALPPLGGKHTTMDQFSWPSSYYS